MTLHINEPCTSHGAVREASLVAGVDHVYVPMVDAAAAFAVLTDRLGLPVMWPYTSFGPFASGGVSLGSIKLEVIEAGGAAPWCRASGTPRIQGIAFRPGAPVDDAYLAALDARGIAHSLPSLFERDGRPAWTNVYFADLIGESAGAFVCDYHLPEPRDLMRRRKALEQCGGGRLGILDAAELVLCSRDPEAAERRWQRLLDPLRPSPAYAWRPEVGPAIRLVRGDDERVGHLALAVRSVAEARRVWREVAPAPLAGFPVRFVHGTSGPGG